MEDLARVASQSGDQTFVRLRYLPSTGHQQLACGVAMPPPGHAGGHLPRTEQFAASPAVVVYWKCAWAWRQEKELPAARRFRAFAVQRSESEAAAVATKR